MIDAQLFISEIVAHFLPPLNCVILLLDYEIKNQTEQE